MNPKKQWVREDSETVEVFTEPSLRSMKLFAAM
jgi:hypothetical protein